MSKLPSRIGRYQVRERIGQGGMGVLYLAFDPAIDRLVAVKLLRVHDDELQQRFYREARSIGRLQHPNIVTIYDIGEHEGQPFIAMEYIAGETLGDVIRRQAHLGLTRKLELMEALCSGLASAHRVGIIHRDIKPANLMLNTQGVLKILDFGIARLVDSTETMTGSMIGTPSYMSPEQVEGRALDHRSDIFSVGLVFYELISYRQAFSGDSSIAIMQSVMSAVPEPLSELVPDIDPAIERIVQRATEKRPDARYSDLELMRADIARIRSRLIDTQSEDTIFSDSRPPQPTPAPTPRRATDRAAIAKRRAEEIQGHLNDGYGALDAGDLDRAQHSAEQAAFLDPDDARAIELLDRVRAAQDQRQIESWLAEARTHLNHEQLTASERLVDRVLELAPDSADGQALKNEIARLHEERERAEALAREVDAALEQAQAQMDAGAFELARDVARRAIERAPQRADARAALRRAEAAIAERDRRAAEELARRQAEEAARRQEAAKRQAEEAARRQAEEAARRQAEDAARRQAEAAKRQAEDAARIRAAEDEKRRLAQEEEDRRFAERRRQAREEEARRAAERQRVAEEDAARRSAERRRLEREENERRAAAEARRRQHEAEARLAAEERLRAPAEDVEEPEEAAEIPPLSAPAPKSRAWLVAAAALVGVAIVGGGIYVYSPRPIETGGQSASGGTAGGDTGTTIDNNSVDEQTAALIKNANAAYDEGRVKEAFDQLRNSPTQNTAVEQALRDLTSRHNAAAAALVESAKKDFAAGRRNEAIASLERFDPTHPAVADALATMKGSLATDDERFTAQLAGGRALLGRDDLAAALREAQNAQRTRPGDARAVSLLNDVLDAAAAKARTARETAQRSDGASARDAFAAAAGRERQAQQARASRNFDGAVQDYQAASQMFARAADEAAAARRADEALAQWAAGEMTRARQLLAGRDFDEADRVLQGIKNRAPNTQGVDTLIRDVQVQRAADAGGSGRGGGGTGNAGGGTTPPPPPPGGGGSGGGRGQAQNDLPGINQALQEFQAAYNARNLQALKSAYALDGRTEGVYKALFDRSVSLDWNYQIEGTQITGTEATVTCGVAVTSVDIRNQRTTSNRRYRVALRKIGDKWRITKMDVM